jgi:protein SCO1/2
MKPTYCLVIGLLALTLAGCSENASKAPPDKLYPLKGKVTAVNTDKATVKIDHEDIPGLMEAMEMEFHVADPKMLSGIKAGDQVQGQVKQAESGFVLTGLEKS